MPETCVVIGSGCLLAQVFDWLRPTPVLNGISLRDVYQLTVFLIFATIISLILLFFCPAFSLFLSLPLILILHTSHRVASFVSSSSLYLLIVFIIFVIIIAITIIIVISFAGFSGVTQWQYVALSAFSRRVRSSPPSNTRNPWRLLPAPMSLLTHPCKALNFFNRVLGKERAHVEKHVCGGFLLQVLMRTCWLTTRCGNFWSGQKSKRKDPCLALETWEETTDMVMWIV